MFQPRLKVYHDGSCPLCRMEIGHYRRQAGAENIEFVDVSDLANDPGPGVSRQAAMRRFHVRLPSGELKSGGAAFIEIWKVLPKWGPAAQVARLPGITSAINACYRLFLPVRPTIARIVGRASGP